MDLIVRGAALSLFLVPTFSFAGPKALAIASGDCKEADLINGATAFSEAVASQLKGDAMDPAQVLERLRPNPIAGLDDTQRQLDAAQSQFYSNQLDHSLEVTRSALRSLERILPSDAAFKQIAAARVLEGLVLKGQGKKNEENDAWKRILRVQPDFALDADYYTPATISQFDALKKEMTKVKRIALSVNSAPAGARVFLDGAPVGKTPFQGTFPSGSYRLQVAQGATVSFVYDVALEQPKEMHIDLAFEGALRSQLPLCVASQGNDYERALKLAALAGADRALVVRVESRNNEPGWVAALLLEVHKGARVREGGMKVSAAKNGKGWADLVSFVLTGEPAKLSVPPSAVTAHEPEPWNPPVASATADSTASESAPTTVSSSSSFHLGVPRVIGIVAAGAGLITACAGLGVYVSGGGMRDAFAAKTNPDGSLKNLSDKMAAEFLEGKIAENQNISIALGVTGLAVLAAGAALFFLMPGSDAPAVSALVTRDAAFVGLSGRFP